MTPAEMADWLRYLANRAEWHDPMTTGRLREAAAMLRAQPTDAQKIEALVHASEAGFLGQSLDFTTHPHMKFVYAKGAAHAARAAMRLLGLNPEGV